MATIVNSAAFRQNAVTSITREITPSGSDRAVYAALSSWGTVAPTSITCGGVSMGAAIASLQDNAEIITWRLYRILNPTAAAQDVVATFAAENVQLGLLVVALSGVDQTTPHRTPSTGAVGDGQPISLSPTSQVGDLVLDFLVGYLGGGSFTPGAGQTAYQTYDPEPNAEVWAGSSEAGAVTSTTMSWAALGGGWTSIALAIVTASGGSSVTKTPTTSNLSLGGRAVLTDAFTSVRIREVLINESGQPIASATNVHLAVWYGGICRGAPDVSLNAQTTDANGTTSWSISTGTLTNGAAIFYVAQDSLSFSNYTAARMIPSYE
jgi:hypothetical protein